MELHNDYAAGPSLGLELPYPAEETPSHPLIGKGIPHQNQSAKSVKGDRSIKCTDINARLQETNKQKNQVNMIAPKEHNNFPVTDPKEIDIYELPKNVK